MKEEDNNRNIVPLHDRQISKRPSSLIRRGIQFLKDEKSEIEAQRHNIEISTSHEIIEIHKEIIAETPLVTVSISPDSKLILAGGWNGKAYIWEYESGKIVYDFSKIMMLSVVSVAFSPVGDIAIICGQGFIEGETMPHGIINVIDLNSGNVTKKIIGHHGTVYSSSFSSNGRYIITGSDRYWTGPIRFVPDILIWDLDNNNEVMRFLGHTSAIQSVAFSEKMQKVISGSWDRSIRVWDVNTAQEERKFTGHDSLVTGVAYINNEKAVLSSSNDGTMRIWNIESGKEIKKILGHQGHVNGVTILHNGQSALSHGDDNTIRLWDIDSGQEIKRIEHTLGVSCVDAAQNGQYAVSCGFDKKVTIYSIWR